MGTCLVIAGAARSGTSALAGALGVCGVELGSNQLPPNQFNPKGYCELWDVLELHDECLASLHLSWDSLLPMPAGWRKGEAALVARAQIRRLYERDFRNSALWAVKDARLCRLLPLWQDELPHEEFRVIVPVRHPFEVASSLARFCGKSWTESLLYWIYNLFESERTTRPFRRVLTTYAELLSNPVSLMTRIERELGLALPRPMEERPVPLAAWVEPNSRSRHDDEGPSESGLESLKALAEFVYRQMIEQGQFHDPNRVDELFTRCFGVAYPSLASTFSAALLEVETDRAALQHKVSAYRSRARFRLNLRSFWPRSPRPLRATLNRLIATARQIGQATPRSGDDSDSAAKDAASSSVPG
jgi:hypothetical protein